MSAPAPSPTVNIQYAVDRAELARRGRIGARVKHLKHDPHEATAKARAGFDARFVREVDPDGMLLAEERERLVQEARRAYFSRLGRMGAEARRKGAQK